MPFKDKSEFLKSIKSRKNSTDREADLEDAMAHFGLGLNDLARNSVLYPSREIIESIKEKAFDDAAEVIVVKLNAYLQDKAVTGKGDPKFRERIRTKMKWIGS